MRGFVAVVLGALGGCQAMLGIDDVRERDGTPTSEAGAPFADAPVIDDAPRADSADARVNEGRCGALLLGAAWPSVGACMTRTSVSRDALVWRGDGGPGGAPPKILALDGGRAQAGGGPALGVSGEVFVPVVGGLAKLARSDGGVVSAWTYLATNTFAQFETPTLAADGTILLSSAAAPQVIALTQAGVEKWAFVPTGIPSAPLVAEDGTVLFTDALPDRFFRASLYALFANGTLRFQFETKENLSLSPALTPDGRAVFLTRNVQNETRCYSINRDGTLGWSTSVDNANELAVDRESNVYVSVSNGVTKLDARGAVQWRTQVIVGRPQKIVLTDDVLFVLSVGFVAGLDPVNGVARWGRDVGAYNMFSSAVATADGALHVVGGPGTYARVAGDGRVDNVAVSLPFAGALAVGKDGFVWAYRKGIGTWAP